MIVMKVKLDNLYAFKDFEIDMSYPKKTVKSSIESEHLHRYPNFRYKKVNIIIGSNASGKTTLGKAMMNILNFITTKRTGELEASIRDNTRPASFTFDFVDREYKLNRMVLDIMPSTNARKRYVFSYDSEVIRIRDSYQTCVTRLESRGRTYCDLSNTLNAIDNSGWVFSYPDERMGIGQSGSQETQLKTLRAILMTLDPSITDVRLLEGVKDTSFIIEKDGREVLLQNGKLTAPERFSSGTLEGITIAGFLAGIIDGLYGFYYCDEHFSYIHSYIEKRILGIMISKLGMDDQLFFTTHNETVLEENLPKHAYTFLVRENGIIKALYANDYVQKPSANLRRAVENDVIRVIPDDCHLDDLED